jgi:hypothetical protein
MGWITIAAIVVALAVGGWRLRRRGERQRQLMLLCRRAGLDFAPVDLFGDTAWLPFPMFGRARSGTENVVWDRNRRPEIRAFDYWYEEPAQDRTLTPRRRLTCAVVPLGAAARRLRIAPRDLDDDVKSVLGLREIRLELGEFNRRFVVQTDDERFAFAFLEQRMMEALLALPDGVIVDVNEDVVLLSAPELPAEQVLRLYDAAMAIHGRIPRSLPSLFPPRPAEGPFEDRGSRATGPPNPQKVSKPDRRELWPIA